jgi:hypothetical protein
MTLQRRCIAKEGFATAVASAQGAGQVNVVGAFTVTMAVQAGFDAAGAGLLLGAASVAGILVRPLMGIAADRGIGGTMATSSRPWVPGSRSGLEKLVEAPSIGRRRV